MKTLSDVLTFFNNACTIIFVVEAMIMMTALGLQRYWTTPLLAFDGFIVVVSIVEQFMSGGAVLSAFRGFRLLRVFKLATKNEEFRQLLGAIIATVMEMGNFVLL